MVQIKYFKTSNTHLNSIKFNHLKLNSSVVNYQYLQGPSGSFIPFQSGISTGGQAVCISDTLSRVLVLLSDLEFRLRTVVVWCIYLEQFESLWGLKGASWMIYANLYGALLVILFFVLSRTAKWNSWEIHFALPHSVCNILPHHYH